MTLVAGIQLILKTTIGVFAADSHTQVKYLTDDRTKNPTRERVVQIQEAASKGHRWIAWRHRFSNS
jgi:hypothetical protein